MSRYGVAVPRGAVAYTAEEAESAARNLGGSVWAVKAQIHAGGRGKGGGIKIAKSPAEVRDLAKKMIGMTLVTKQTGPAGREVKRIYIESGCDIDRELYLEPFGGPGHGAGDADGLHRGRHGHRRGRRQPSRENLSGVHRPRLRPDARACAARRLWPGAQGRRCRLRHQAGERALQGLHRPRRQPGGDQSAGADQGRRGAGARCQDEFRRQRPVPAEGRAGAARRGRGRSRRGRGQPPRPQLHQAGRQYRLHGQRRRSGHGDHGHHQAPWRRARELPGCGRRRHQGTGDRGVQDHPLRCQCGGHPGQYLRRHHALRRHRRGRGGGGARRSACKCRWWSGSKAPMSSWARRS